MALADEKRIILSPSGVAELQIDRVKKEFGIEQKRLKLTRHPFDGRLLNSTGERFVCYPPGCVLVQQTQGDSLYVIQQPPTVRSVVWKYYPDEMVESLMRRGCVPKFGLDPQTFRSETVRRLSFPYVIFVVKTRREQMIADHVQLYFRTDPIRSWDDDLYLPSVPNFHSDQHHICFGTAKDYFRYGNLSLSMQIERMVEGFWNTPFNDHWIETYSRYAGLVPQLVTPWDWEYHSTHDPLFVLEAPWIPAGMKLKDYLLNQGALQDQSETQFHTLVGLGQSAPRYVPGIDDEQLVVCQAPAVIFDGVLFARGDVRTVKHPLGIFETDATYTIEHFFEPKKDPTKRMMKLVEQNEPVSMQQFLESTQSKNVTQSRFVFEGVEARIGSYVYFDDKVPSANLRGKTFCVEDIRIDAEGDLEIKFASRLWEYATTENGTKLMEGFHFADLKITEDGVFSFCDRTLKVGELIQLKDYSGIPGALERDGYKDLRHAKVGQFLRVLQIRLADTRHGTLVLVRFSEYTAEVVLFRLDSYLLTWKTVPFSCEPDQFRFDEKTLRFDADTQLLYTGVRSTEVGTRLYKPIRFVHTMNQKTKMDEIDLEIEFGNAPIPVMRNGQYLFPETYEFVEMKFEDLRAGDVLRFEKDMDPIKSGTELTILCFRVQTGEIQFTNGWYVHASAELLASVRRRTADGTEEPLRTIPVPMKESAKKKEFIVGERVIYRASTWNVVRCHRCVSHVQHLTIENDQAKTVDVHWNELRPIGSEFLLKWFEAEIRTNIYRNRRTGNTFQISPRQQKRQAELLNLRMRVGTDREGRDLFLGDMVCIVQHSFTGNASFQFQDPYKISMMIIHSAELGSGKRFGYLLTEDPSVYHGHTPHDIRGWDSLKDWGRTLFDERRVGTNFLSDCEKLEPVMTESRERTLPQIPIGSLVQVRSNRTPAFGWGLVKPEERGTLLEVVKDEVTVRFPSDPEWMAKLVDIELAFHVGDRVCVHQNIHPVYFYGKTVGGLATGVIREIHDGRVRVEFPEQPNWYGFVEEIIHT